jgi:hypothetical protein
MKPICNRVVIHRFNGGAIQRQRALSRKRNVVSGSCGDRQSRHLDPRVVETSPFPMVGEGVRTQRIGGRPIEGRDKKRGEATCGSAYLNRGCPWLIIAVQRSARLPRPRRTGFQPHASLDPHRPGHGRALGLGLGPRHAPRGASAAQSLQLPATLPLAVPTPGLGFHRGLAGSGSAEFCGGSLCPPRPV